MCNTDASWRKETRRAGLGWIFTEPRTETKIRGSEAQDFVSSPLLAEALACRTSLHHAISLGFDNLRIQSDNQTLIRAINSKHLPKGIFGVVSDINCLAACFASISFSFVYRSVNSEADALAKEALLLFSLGSVMG